MKKLVIKIQLPLIGDLALIYDKEHMIYLQWPAEDVDHLFRKDEYKVYYNAEYDPSTNELQILDRIKEHPNW